MADMKQGIAQDVHGRAEAPSHVALSARIVDALPAGARSIMDALITDGHSAELVGGAVRDIAMGLPVHDWDIATDAMPSEVSCSVLEHLGAVAFPTGIAYGTVTVTMPDGQFQVTTHRPLVGLTVPTTEERAASLDVDLALRDATLDAVAWSLANGIHDPLGGLVDLSARVLRCPGNPSDRLAEDPVRILRLMRLSATHGLDIAPSTVQAMREGASLISDGLTAHAELEGLTRKASRYLFDGHHRGEMRELSERMDVLESHSVSPERVLSELRCLVSASDGRRVEDMLLAFREVVFAVIPEMRACDGLPQTSRYHRLPVYEHIAECVRWCPPDEVTRMAALFHDIGKPETETHGPDGRQHFYGHPAVSADIAKAALERLHAPKGYTEEVVTLVRHHDDRIMPRERSVRRALARLGSREAFSRFVDISMADVHAHSELAWDSPARGFAVIMGARDVATELAEQDDVFTVRDLAIGGSDLLSMGYEQGPAIGEELRRLLDMVLDGKVENTGDALGAFAKADLGRDGV